MPDNTDNKAVKKRQAEDKQKLIAVLKELPIILPACKRAGTSRDTYYRWRHEDKVFRQESEDALNQGREFVNDMSESQLMTLIKEKKLPACVFWLRNNNPRYGGKAGQRVPVSALPELNPEDEKVFKRTMALLSGSVITEEHGT
jgi:hypothetical protein